ncbi:hypothetical protein IFM89_023912 [Coptis chinensis]|uniref:Uncharacterized protein n=1 Tax=Coptis chinensis TaxID=261450 RepID=A0A835I4U6_9MAGN|nr:hypothetical protein IFM89_023912 [Coptis chinensis]
MDDYVRTHHIPAFGNWDYEDGLPITQYFESARQAGLFHYTSYDGEGDLYSYSGYYDEKDYNNSYLKPISNIACKKEFCMGEERNEIDYYLGFSVVSPFCFELLISFFVCTKGSEKNYYPHVKEQKKQGRVHDLTRTARPYVHTAPKAVDEDLYTIPPDQLQYTYPKKRKMFGFLSRCLAPSCAA